MEYHVNQVVLLISTGTIYTVIHDNIDATWDVAVIELYCFMIIDGENDTGNY